MHLVHEKECVLVGEVLSELLRQQAEEALVRRENHDRIARLQHVADVHGIRRAAGVAVHQQRAELRRRRGLCGRRKKRREAVLEIRHRHAQRRDADVYLRLPLVLDLREHAAGDQRLAEAAADVEDHLGLLFLDEALQNRAHSFLLVVAQAVRRLVTVHRRLSERGRRRVKAQLLVRVHIGILHEVFA